MNYGSINSIVLFPCHPRCRTFQDMGRQQAFNLAQRQHEDVFPHPAQTALLKARILRQCVLARQQAHPGMFPLEPFHLPGSR